MSGPILAADLFRALPPEKRRRYLESLTDRESEGLAKLWEFWARPDQLAPEGDWFVFLILAGRGWGKSRVGAEWVKEKALARPNTRIALVAATFADGRRTMFEGESGLLSVLPRDALKGQSDETAYNRTYGELTLLNGSKFFLFTSERPRQLRGPQFHYGWCDELSSWEDADLGNAEDTTWSNLMFGLRLGNKPQCIVTTTPRRGGSVKLLKQIAADPMTVVRRGSTYQNIENLSEAFRRQVLNRYEGTYLGRQEIHGEMIDEVIGALWTPELVAAARLRDRANVPLYGPPPGVELRRVVVGVDPAGRLQDMERLTLDIEGDGKPSTGDDAGLAVAALGSDGLYYVLADASCNGSPYIWGPGVVDAYQRWQADLVVGEDNHGGKTVEQVVRVVAARRGTLHVSYRPVHASRGKQTRAEPIAMLYEQGQVKHCGDFVELEEELTQWVPGMDSPNRMDALVFALTELTGGSGTMEDEDEPFGSGRI